MRLSEFILQNLEPILQAWEDFAKTVVTPMPPLSSSRLRNHAEQILRTAARDMQTPQTLRQEIAKSQGHGPANEGETAAQSHALTRLEDGFSLDQMVAEYRALRSSVLRLWLSEGCSADSHQAADIIRFNEAIDQALVESISAYGKAVAVTRKRVLGILGHDLRSPLGAILMASDLLCKRPNLATRETTLAAQIWTSVNRANEMVNDLLDLARSNLAPGISLHLENTELTQVCDSVVAEIRTAHPDARIEFAPGQEIAGRFDSVRVGQVFSNLIGNAVQHGDAQYPVLVQLSSNGLSAIFSVCNRGELIPPHAMPYLFNPEGRYSTYAAQDKGSSAGLGLGLFITAQIVDAHGGRIEVSSTTEEGTVFTAHLPIT
ncbi:sensor histidine kinase [Pseudomonas sp. Pseu.R1]|uniref:sensor histidine kinase n=1 Tax=Pseudomonas sp. Pseu.R1 TaxID=3379818 RepID=UPI003B92944D